MHSYKFVKECREEMPLWSRALLTKMQSYNTDIFKSRNVLKDGQKYRIQSR